jgi:hypothetical protein
LYLSFPSYRYAESLLVDEVKIVAGTKTMLVFSFNEDQKEIENSQEHNQMVNQINISFLLSNENLQVLEKKYKQMARHNHKHSQLHILQLPGGWKYVCAVILWITVAQMVVAYFQKNS